MKGGDVRGYPKAKHWDELRAKVLLRDECCVMCMSYDELTVHHEFGMWKDGQYWTREHSMDKMVILCGKCHRRLHSGWIWGYGIRRRVRWYLEALYPYEEWKRFGRRKLST